MTRLTRWSQFWDWNMTPVVRSAPASRSSADAVLVSMYPTCSYVPSSWPYFVLGVSWLCLLWEHQRFSFVAQLILVLHLCYYNYLYFRHLKVVLGKLAF